jgi:hypothetical protein
MASLNLQERMEEVLKAATRIGPDVIGSAIVSIEDGLPIAVSQLSSEAADDISAMSVTLFGTAEQLAEEVFPQVPLEQIFMKSKQGYIFLNAIDAETVLVLVTTDKVKIGMVFLEMRRHIIPELSSILAQ